MTIYPFNFDTVVNASGSGAHLLQRMAQTYNDVSPITKTLWTEFDIDTRAELGDQSGYSRNFAMYPLYSNRNTFQFNLIRSFVNHIVGDESQHRTRSIVIPRRDGNQQVADDYSECLQYSHERDNVPYTHTQCYRRSTVCGLSFSHTYLDYHSDPINGVLKKESIPYSAVMFDPWGRKLDTSDWSFVWVRKYMTQDQMGITFPDHKKLLKGIRPASYRDDKFIYIQENFSMQSRPLISVDEFWYADTRTGVFICDRETGEVIEWFKGDKDEDLDELLASHPEMKIIKRPRRTVKRGVVVNNNIILEEDKNPYNIDRYPYQPCFAYFEPDSEIYGLKMQGITRGIRDVQWLYNHRKKIELDMLESVATTGKKVMEGSLVDDSSVFNTGQGRVFFIKKDAPFGMDSVQDLIPPVVPPSTIELSQLLTQDMERIVGISAESMGMDINDKAAAITNLRQLASQKSIQPLLDNYNLFKKIDGELDLEMMLANWTPGKVRSIIQREPDPLFFSRMNERYNVAVASGYDTPTQKQMGALQMFQLHQLGYPIPIETMMEQVDIQNKTQVTKQIQETMQQQQQMQQMEMQMKMQEFQMRAKAFDAKSYADRGLGDERYSRIEENKALEIQRIAEAQEAREHGVLDKIKAIQEVMGLEVEQLHRALDVVDRLEMGARASEQEIKGEVEKKPVSQESKQPV